MDKQVAPPAGKPFLRLSSHGLDSWLVEVGLRPFRAAVYQQSVPSYYSDLLSPFVLHVALLYLFPTHCSMNSISLAEESDSSQSGDEGSGLRRRRLSSTPRTPLSPEDAFPSLGVSRAHRSGSFVRFQGLETSSEGRNQASSAVTSKKKDFPTSHEEDETTEFQIRLFDRIINLENQFNNLEISGHFGSSERAEESSERTGLSTDIQWMTWQEYLEDASKATNILEVLIEKPHTNSRRKSSVVQPLLDAPPKMSTKLSSRLHKSIERIRIRSVHIINALQIITEQTFSSSSRLIIHRPFKVLLFYHEQISDYLAELEHDFTQNTQCHCGEQCKGYIKIEDEPLSPQTPKPASRTNPQQDPRDRSPYRLPSDTSPRTSADKECKHEISEELLAQVEAITHLRVLTKFMKEDMKEIFAKHELLRSSKAEMIAFQDLWHLFMAGDLIVAEDESSGRGIEVYQLSILPACDSFSSRRPVKQIQTKTEGTHHAVESVYKEEAVSAMSVFTLDVFYFDYDGQKFGPVERRLELVSWEGEKKITDLPLYPLRFRKDAAQFKATLLERGMKFRELSATNDYPHREYSGLSVGEPQEQVSTFRSNCEGDIGLTPSSIRLIARLL